MITLGSMKQDPKSAQWTIYDYVIAVALLAVGFMSLYALLNLFS